MSVLRWGLVPFWAKDVKIGARMINARAETVQEKPAFRAAFRSRRCLIPANGWFEWKRTGPTGGGKQPYFLALESGSALSFAALWEQWGRDGQHLETFTIITTEASPALSDIHDRQPAVVDPDDYTDWLDPGTPAETLQEIIGTPHEGPYEIRPVSDRVNRVANDTPDILESVGEANAVLMAWRTRFNVRGPTHARRVPWFNHPVVIRKTMPERFGDSSWSC